MFRLIAGCLVCLSRAACGESSTSDRQQITNLFNGMYTAMAHADFGTACG